MRFAVFETWDSTAISSLVSSSRVAYLWQDPRAIMDLFDEPIEEVGKKLDAQCGEAPGHSTRVTKFAVALAKKMGLPKSEIGVIWRGAYFHNVGKLEISDDILRRSGDPSPEDLM